MSLTPRAGTESLPLSVAQHLEQVCARFETAWVSGSRPTIENFLDDIPQSAHLVLLGELLRVEVTHRIRAGEQPTAVEYQQRFPALAAAIDTLIREAHLPAPAPASMKAASGRETMLDTDPTGPYVSQGLPAPKASVKGRLPAIPGYEILGVLGQGGMGIVYQARHLKLNRLVALKMIRAADQVSDEALSRFLREARAVAHLQHANIVQIYEIGEHDGLPYFSLEFVDGGSLNKHINGQPQPAQAAAALVETLARAMNYAHQRQIVHRDLKPANILLARGEGQGERDEKKRTHSSPLAPPSSPLIPKISDFGLAKQLDADLGQTQANAVMGTPSYMAPEQAAGKNVECGPLADLYALGAILYELLTGRPPFKGNTVLETLEQVRTQEPVAPSKIVPKVPRDLETICLKCLAKDPARRYTSALMLAQDLERFQAGEPILGRREGAAARTWRKIRRNPLVAAAALAVVVALAVAGYIGTNAYDDRQKAAIDRQLAAVTRDIEVGLQAPEITEPYLQRMEALVADLDRLAPDKAAAARARLHQRFADRIRDTFRDRLTADQMPHIEAAIALLTPRDPSLANEVQKEYVQRRMTWTPSFELTAPFTDLNTVFDATRNRLELTKNNTLLGRTPSDAKVKTGPAVYTRTSGQGNVKLVAVFDRSWATASQLQLFLNSGKGIVYIFTLRVPPDGRTPDPKNPPTTFAEAKKTGKSAEVNIYCYVANRRSEILNLQPLEVAELFAGCLPDGSLRLEAKREGDRLSVQVNRRDPLEFHDLFPLSLAEPGLFGLFWPETVQLKSLHGYHLPSPAVPSVLESADDSFNRGEYEGALASCQQVLLQSHKPQIRQEARYKEGVCLLALKRENDAIPIFHELAAAAGADPEDGIPDRWPLLAECQVLVIYTRQKTPEGRTRADAILDKLALRQGNLSGKLGALVPNADRTLILGQIPQAGISFVSRRPDDLIKDCERAVKAAELFETGKNSRWYTKITLIRAYRLANREREAMQRTQDLLSNFQEYCNSSHQFGLAILDEYCWMKRLRDKNNVEDVQLALKELDRWLFRGDGVVRQDEIGSAYPLFLERARLHAALKDWDEADKDLQRFFQEQAKAPARMYVHHANACLMQGFLRERQGDSKGAAVAWRRGLFHAWKKDFSDINMTQYALRDVGTIGLIHYVILASLTGEFSDRDVEDALMGLYSEGTGTGLSKGGGSSIAELIKLMNVRPEVLRQVWLTPRAREWARRIAFRDLSTAEYYRVPAFLFGMEYVHQGAFAGQLSQEQDDLLWKLSQDSYAAFLGGKLKTGHLLVLGSVWNGLNIPGFGWSSVTPVLAPPVRGPVAYVLGNRYLRLANPKQAAVFFRSALADAPAASALRRLAQAELDRLRESAGKK